MVALDELPDRVKGAIEALPVRGVSSMAGKSSLSTQTWHNAVNGVAVSLSSLMEMEKTLGVELFDRVELERELVRQFRAIVESDGSI